MEQSKKFSQFFRISNIDEITKLFFNITIVTVSAVSENSNMNLQTLTGIYFILFMGKLLFLHFENNIICPWIYSITKSIAMVEAWISFTLFSTLVKKYFLNFFSRFFQVCLLSFQL